MNKIIKYITVISLVGFLFSGCSKLKEDLPAEVIGESIAHGPGFSTPGHPNFHGNLFLKAGTSMDQCKTCHGQTFTGGRTEVNCAKCHTPGITVHANDSLLVPGSSSFHGYFFKAASQPLTSCQSCHGPQFQGKGAAISCAQCHSSIDVHKAGIVDPASPNFHGKYFQAHSFNDLLKCKSCHGESFTGGISAPTCKTCHTQQNGPEACNTCHGDFSDPSKIAPPKDVAGNTAVTFRGVGAHAKHLYTNTTGKVVCAECHTPVTSVYSPSHIDDTPNAEVNFNGPVSKKTDTYDKTNLTCSSYCHGNFSFSKSQAAVADQYAYTGDVITGAMTASPVWTSTGTAKCGTCHALPPKGHVGYPDQIPVTSCGSSACHLNVVDASGNIINNGKHMNGAKNVRGN